MIETIKTSRYTIKQILQDNWDSFYEKHKSLIRPVVIENVKKVMACELTREDQIMDMTINEFIGALIRPS